MTKKHYELLAQALANTRPLPRMKSRYSQWSDSLNEIVKILAADNSEFIQSKFVKACKTW